MCEGVYPLVCAACHRVVGVINAAELNRMDASGEVYICDECMRSANTEAQLSHQRNNLWLGLTGAEIVSPGQLLVSDGRA